MDSVSIDVLRGEEGAVDLFDDPRFAVARSDDWQLDRARRLAHDLGLGTIQVRAARGYLVVADNRDGWWLRI